MTWCPLVLLLFNPKLIHPVLIHRSRSPLQLFLDDVFDRLLQIQRHWLCLGRVSKFFRLAISMVVVEFADYIDDQTLQRLLISSFLDTQRNRNRPW